MASVRSEVLVGNLGSFLGHRIDLRVGYDHAPCDIYLCIRAYITEFYFAGFFIVNERSQVLACRRVGVVKLPVYRIDAHRPRHKHGGYSIYLCILGSFSVPADDNSAVGLT